MRCLVVFTLVLASIAMASRAHQDRQLREPKFQVKVRAVEVPVNVFDGERPVTGLTEDRFELFDDDKPQQLVRFEEVTTPVVCALLLDTTGSMRKALPQLKASVNRFVDALREGDRVAVYQFRSSLELLQPFSTDHRSAKKAIMGARAQGATALFDALTRVVESISTEPRKKLIVVFTDGQDNASGLPAYRAVAAAQRTGVPVYSIAQGEAARSQALVKVLKQIARSTGGIAFASPRADEMDEIFREIVKNVRHTYMLAYNAPPAEGRTWRHIRVTVKGGKKLTVRAREGYVP